MSFVVVTAFKNIWHFNFTTAQINKGAKRDLHEHDRDTSVDNSLESSNVEKNCD